MLVSPVSIIITKERVWMWCIGMSVLSRRRPGVILQPDLPKNTGDCEKRHSQGEGAKPGLEGEAPSQGGGGYGDGKGNGDEEGQSVAQPVGVNVHGPATGGVESLEEVGNFMHAHEPKGCGGDDEPEAIDHDRTHDKSGEKSQG